MNYNFLSYRILQNVCYPDKILWKHLKLKARLVGQLEVGNIFAQYFD